MQCNALYPAELFADQSRRWRQGERLAVEVYLEQWPSLRQSPSMVMDLICNEIILRGEQGETVTLSEYLERFPEQAPELKRRLGWPRTPQPAAEAATPALSQTPQAEQSTETDPQPRGRMSPSQWPNIPGYEIDAYIDGGGQGDVYRAQHLRLKRVVALKILRPSGSADEEHLRRFQREAQLSARLDHPNIVRLFDYHEHEGRLFLSMEFVAGGSLKDLLARDRVMPPKETAALVATLADAVQHAHEQGVIHRDLKPGNVLFTRDGIPKVADFGLAKQLGPEASDLTQTRVILGTAGYMAPEQAAGLAKQATEKTDVYALGAILYRALTGHAPFAGDDWLEVLIQVRTKPPVRPTERLPGLPIALEQICLKCLEKEPARRYASAAALAADLRRFLAGEPARPAQDDGLPASPGDEVAGPERTWTTEDRPEEAARHGSGFPVIPGYEILEQLGRGGMGAVYRARQLSLKRIVALKTIIGQVTEQEWRRLRLEAEAVAMLQHPHILQVYDLGEHAGMVYIAMEYVDGGTLYRMLCGEPQPPVAAAELLEQLAQAVGFAHRRGIIHRDLNSANILLVPPARREEPDACEGARQRYGFPKVTDFGLMRRLGEDDSSEGIVGTPSYMSPEQVAGRTAEMGPQTDVWGLGVILYEMLTGRPPFRGANFMDVLKQVIQGEVSPPGKLQPVPPDLESICLKCLQKDPAHRYADGEELAEDLRRFLDGHRTTARPTGGFWARLFRRKK